MKKRILAVVLAGAVALSAAGCSGDSGSTSATTAAAGSVAANQVLGSAADGHTFLYGHNLVNVANIAGVTDYNYTAFKLGPTFAKDPAQQLYVNSEKYADLNAFIEAAKAAPGQLKACTEVGAYTYYELLAFEKAAGIDLDLVDVGSNSDKITAMLSGQVDLMPGVYINCKDYLAAGQFGCIGAPTLVQKILADSKAAEAVANVDMMPFYLSGADSAKHDEEIFNTIKKIADELAQ